MNKFWQGAIGGFVFGIFFAAAHTFFGFRYNILYFLVIQTLGKTVSCQGTGCRPYLLLAAAVSSLGWAVVGALIAYTVRRVQAASSSEV